MLLGGAGAEPGGCRVRGLWDRRQTWDLRGAHTGGMVQVWGKGVQCLKEWERLSRAGLISEVLELSQVGARAEGWEANVREQVGVRTESA